MRVRPLTSATARGALFAAAPAPIALIGWWRGAAAATAGAEVLIPAGFAAFGFAAAAGLLAVRPAFSRTIAGLAIACLLYVAGPSLVVSPAMTLLLGVVLLLAYMALRTVTAPGIVTSGTNADRARPSGQAARGAAGAALALWLLSRLAGAANDDDPIGYIAIAVSQGLASLLVLRWAIVFRWVYPRRALVIIFALAAIIFVMWQLSHDWWRYSGIAALHSIVVLLVVPGTSASDDSHTGNWWDPIFGHPERLFVATFAVLCTIGALLLAIPASSADGLPIAIEDAAFTSVSAVCVTGLTVVDTGHAFSPLGQGFVLLLIQAGGLGIMTFSTAAIRLLGRRMSLRHEGVVARLVSSQDRSQVFNTTVRLLLFTFTVEAVGALLLFIAFTLQGIPLGEAVWHAVFTAISAFCNAGFALHSDSLVSMNGDPIVLHTVAILIILGGLSPAVVLAIPSSLRRRRPIPPQARLALVTTGVLLLVGFGTYLAVEWSTTLKGLPIGDRIQNAWFQSVTLRTAGFNSVDFSALQPATLVMMMTLMFIGGSPGGTAGGIKTTTLGVLVTAVVAAIRGRHEIVIYGRRVSIRTVFRAAANVAASVAVVLLGLLLLTLTQNMSLRHASFETVSAFGTVGLTIGGTSELDTVGKVIVMAIMFIGRVGALTILVFLSQGARDDADWRRPEVDIDVA
ncbi:MAG: hypothetical protein KC635_02455 [Myxococcales bacterium]|nr:hypothetical protein [Myxococcales bacterium]MCB9732389.1 potassium transporter TrkH [Deltaproteobacteria bacterium]